MAESDIALAEEEKSYIAEDALETQSGRVATDEIETLETLNESTGSIIDLVSEDGNACSRAEFDSPRFTPIAAKCAPTPRIMGLDKENEGDLMNLDPRELSFTLPPIETGAARVYKPSEWGLVDWNAVSQEQMKEWMQFFGVKTTGGKAFMVRTMKEVFRYISDAGSGVNEEVKSKEGLFNEFSEVIKEEIDLYERIILFEPVGLNEVHALLRHKKKPHWQLSLACVREYLDITGAQYCNTSTNSGHFGAFVTGQRREPVHEDDESRKKRRKLRVSVSAP